MNKVVLSEGESVLSDDRTAGALQKQPDGGDRKTLEIFAGTQVPVRGD